MNRCEIKRAQAVQCLNCGNRGMCGKDKRLKSVLDGVNCENFTEKQEVNQIPYFNIAYIRPETDDCVCVLTQSESKESATEAFKAKYPDFEFVSCWERPDFKPV